MDYLEVIKRLEACDDLTTSSQRLQDYIEISKNIFLAENNFEEGKRVCTRGRDIALANTRKYKEHYWYELYMLALKYLGRYFLDFDSYMLFLEHYRDPQDQFYLPRREIFKKHNIVQSFQDMLEDKLDILTVSLIPGGGKSQPLYSSVLTPNGFTLMRNITVGSKVISASGKESTVLGVFPQGKKPVMEFILDDGKRARSSDEHLWKVFESNKDDASFKVVTVQYIVDNFKTSTFLIPCYDAKNKSCHYYKLVDIVYVGVEECQCIYIDDPTHLYVTDDYIVTHNTTLEEFFMSYVMGLYPDLCNLFSSYSGKITDMFHRSIYEIITSKEYAWHEVFPDVEIEAKSDKDQYINLGKYKPFKTLTCRSIDSSTTGVTRAEGYLLCDDLVSGIEEALSPDRLEKLYTKYLSDLKSRRKKGCKEIHICTRWSVHDVVGHLIANYEGSERARFIAIDCYDENGESNFDYKYNKGFDTAYLKEMEAVMDDVTFRCLYRSDPIEREGLLYHKTELQYYLGGLPIGEDGFVKEADAILGVCDTKDTGTDFNCLPVVYQYGNKFYLEDVVYDNGSPYVLDDLNSDCLVRNNVQMCQFESNKEGSRTGDEVQKKVEEKGGRCVITKKYTTANKETKIIVNSDWVKKHVLFKDESEWTPMYRAFMKSVYSYVTLGKNKHDDAVDALAMLALFVQSFEGAQIEIMDRSALGF